MKTIARPVLALACASALALGAAACSKPADTTTTPTSAAGASSSAPSPTSTAALTASEILDKAKANAQSATSGAFSGQVDQGGKTLSIDFKGTRDGKTVDIKLAMGDEGSVRVISVAKNVYMQADPVFWKSQGAPAAVQKAGDKFVKAPAEAASMTKDLSLSAFLDEAFGKVTSAGMSETVGSETVNGVDSWVLTDKKGTAEGALYVSKDKLELVRFTGSTSSPGQLDFSRWNEDLGITAPPADQILDLS